MPPLPSERKHSCEPKNCGRIKTTRRDQRMKCSTCGKEQATEKERLPRGWKRTATGVFCNLCWRKLYFIKAVTFPVVSLDDPKRWPELRAALSQAWGDSTRLANWAVSQLALADIPCRTAEMQKLPKFKPPYLYPLARNYLPGLGCESVVAILNAAAQKYMKERYERL